MFDIDLRIIVTCTKLLKQMDKTFYFALIALLSIGVYSVLEILQEMQEFEESSVKKLCPEFLSFDILFVMVCFITSALFFGYRFFQGKFFPILSTIVDIFYLFLSWRLCIRYCTDPVAYLSRKSFIWEAKEFQGSKQDIMSEFDCCGINETQLKTDPSCDRRQTWTCSTAVALHKGKDLRERVWGIFTKSFIHIAALLCIWVTHLTGGLEDDIFNDKNRSTYQYSQV